jgi:hypothetical protein
MGISAAANSGNVNHDHLQTVLGGRDTRWYRGYLLKLNLIIAVLTLASAGNGFDGSMMNGLQ